MLGILHGYLLEGSGSNLWTRAITRALCAQGRDVALFCQENHPERYDFVARAILHRADGLADVCWNRETPYPGTCMLHQPLLGDTLPVFVWDRYEEFSRVVPMVELADAEIRAYVERNVEVVARVAQESGVTALLANHAVLMPVVAQEVARRCGIPYAVMPHGSAIEYAVKRDTRFHELASDALAGAGRVFAIGGEIRTRLRRVFPAQHDLDARTRELPLGVDTGAFQLLEREERPKAIAELGGLLEGLPRGREGALPAALRRRLEGPVDLPGLREDLDVEWSRDAKRPDADLEARLEHVDWEQDPLLLFVGRLIGSKGIQAIVAALPEILEANPRLRLLAVGHGPLREILEALMFALARGRHDWADALLEGAEALEGGSPGSFDGFRAHVGLAPDARESWYARAARTLHPDRVIFTGYLTHRELARVFPCCDVAVFPSIVAEAGPLVFLEALASGCFPMGPYFAGMGASIDAASTAIPPDAAERMKLSADPARLIGDIVRNVPLALEAAPATREALHQLAVSRYDWQAVARKLAEELDALAAESG